MSPRRLSDLERGERRRALIRTVIIVAVAWVLLITLYYLVPAARDHTAAAVPRLAGGLALVGAVVGWQTARISRAELPELRAIQALGVIIPLFLILFASLYLSLSEHLRLQLQSVTRSHPGAVLHRHGLLHGRIRRHHPNYRSGPSGGECPDADGPGHHRRGGPPARQRGQDQPGPKPARLSRCVLTGARPGRFDRNKSAGLRAERPSMTHGNVANSTRLRWPSCGRLMALPSMCVDLIGSASSLPGPRRV